MAITWIYGAIINIAGSILINLGTNIMKLGHNKRAFMDGKDADKPSIVKFKEWKIGIGIYVVGNLLNFGSFAFAAQSLLSALGSVQFVANVVFASLVLKEPVTLTVLLATACIVGGCILLVIFGSHESTTYDVEQQIELYNEPLYITYLVMAFVFAFGSYVAYMQGKNVASINLNLNLVSVSSRECIKEGIRQPKFLPGTRMKSFWIQIMPVAYSIYSGLIGTQSVVFSKSLSMLLRLSFNGDNQMKSWFTYVMLLCFLITAFFFMSRLNQGLGMFPAMLIVPLMQICWTLFSIISGMLFWQEYKVFTTLMAVMFTIGVLIVFVGVYLLTLNAKIQYEKEDEALRQLQETELLEAQALDPGDPDNCSVVGSEHNPNQSMRHSIVGSPDGFGPYPRSPSNLNSTLLKEHSNPIYDPNPQNDDPNKPRKGDVFDTLIFTSLASTIGGTRAHLNASLQRNAQRIRASEGGENAVESTLTPNALNGTNSSRPVLNSSIRSGTNPNETPSPLNASNVSNGDKSSLMETFKRSFRSMQKRITNDFSVVDTDTNRSITAAAGRLPASPDSQGGHDHIASSLPQSRFYDNKPTLGKLSTIKEVSSSVNMRSVLAPVDRIDEGEEERDSRQPSKEGSSSSQIGDKQLPSNGVSASNSADRLLDTQPATADTDLASSLNSTKRRRMKALDAESEDERPTVLSTASTEPAGVASIGRGPDRSKTSRQNSGDDLERPISRISPKLSSRNSPWQPSTYQSKAASLSTTNGSYGGGTGPDGSLSNSTTHSSSHTSNTGGGMGGGGRGPDVYAPILVDIKRSPMYNSQDLFRPTSRQLSGGMDWAGGEANPNNRASPGWPVYAQGGGLPTEGGIGSFLNAVPSLAQAHSSSLAVRREHAQLRAGDYSGAGYMSNSIEGMALPVGASSTYVPRPYSGSPTGGQNPGGYTSPRMYSQMLDHPLTGGGVGGGGGVFGSGGVRGSVASSGSGSGMSYANVRGSVGSSGERSGLPHQQRPVPLQPVGGYFTQPQPVRYQSPQGRSGGGGGLSVSRAWNQPGSNGSSGNSQNPSPLRYQRY
eukprot:gene25205-10848_t